MKYSFKVRIMGYIFHSACKKEYVKRGITKQAAGDIMTEHKRIVKRAKDMNDGKLLSSYIMGIYFIAMNRCSGLSAEENYAILAAAFSGSKLLKKGLGTAESYLDEKNLPGRLQWSMESHARKNENNWVVDVLPKCAEYDLGYDYHEFVHHLPEQQHSNKVADFIFTHYNISHTEQQCSIGVSSICGVSLCSRESLFHNRRRCRRQGIYTVKYHDVHANNAPDSFCCRKSSGGVPAC